MAYTSNPLMGKVRRLAVNDVIFGRLNQSQTALKYGVTRSAICKWMQRATKDHKTFIETLPSRPLFHPNQISEDVIERLVYWRDKTHRCAPVIHAHLVQEGHQISVATVGRILAREGLTRKKKRAPWGTRIPRPLSDRPGSLVEIDTMHVVKADYSRFYIFAVIDTYSRLGYAEYANTLRQTKSLEIIQKAHAYFGFPFQMVQSDNGPEFKTGFKHQLQSKDIHLRHSRIRRPNDNAHIERFIRTIQDECFNGSHPRETTVPGKLARYIDYYNNQRLHLSLGLTTPRQFVSKVLD
jgi:transposase InsO family protein